MPCNKLISDYDIDTIYSNVGNKPQNNFTVKVNTNCISSSNKKAFIDFNKNINSEKMLIKPIEREYCENEKFIFQEKKKGKIVKHQLFLLKPKYQKKGIATDVLKNEIEIYKELNFKEIQLIANWDGLIVWKKLNFKFANRSDERFLIPQLRLYLKNIKKLSHEKIKTILGKKPFEISVEYLIDEKDSKNSFSNWIYEEAKQKKTKAIGIIKMVMEL